MSWTIVWNGNLQDPPITPLQELDAAALQDLMPEIPFWVKSPDYERVSFLSIENSTHDFLFCLWFPIYFIYFSVFPISWFLVPWLLEVQVDWLNKFIHELWPFLEKVVLPLSALYYAEIHFSDSQFTFRKSVILLEALRNLYFLTT